MSVGVGTRLGSHEVLSALGKGGMGEVWRARDTKLGRDVAIKTLPAEFAQDEDRLARFEREARLLASLNHPNIASIYGLEESGGTRFLVLELVEGETLADLVRRGPIPADEALKLGVQIATAAEAAHEKGVVHRDLKPANIKITPDGKVKVLDFGLAKALQSSEQNASNSPTLSMAATARGIILGTAAYMSPEQARGTVVDSRTDIWAFGCVLYEMLTGRQAFRGEMVSDILASVLAREPDFNELHAALHPRLRETIQRCLEKDPKRRWQAIGDVRMEIERLQTSGSVMAPRSVAPSRARPQSILPWAAAAALVGAAAAWMLKPGAPSAPRPIVRFDYVLPESEALRGTGRTMLAMSADGRYFVYNTIRGLVLRSLDSVTARLIPGTGSSMTSPFLSPDGEWVGYFTGSAQGAAAGLRKMSISGGAPVTVGPASNPFGVSWSADGTILFGQPAGIMRVPASGGIPQLVIKTKPTEVVYGPSMLPDGKTVLYTATSSALSETRWDQAEIRAQALDSIEPKVLLRGGSDARYVPTGHLVYAVGDVLFAVAFDVGTLEVKGGPVALISDVQRATNPVFNTAAANFAFSDHGAFAYLHALPSSAEQTTLAIFDRSGAFRRLDVPPATYRSPRASPDGTRIAVESVGDNGQSLIWIYDLAGRTAIRRLTQEGSNTRPTWTRDGKRVAYGSNREKAHGIYWQSADGSALPERLTTAEDGFVHFPESFSPDGRVLSFGAVRASLGPGSWSLWTLAIDGATKKASLFYDVAASNEFGSAFSPDGQWIAYASTNEPDPRFAIYIQPYPPTGVKYEISKTGGAWPVWSPDGSELFYRPNVLESNGGRLKAVRIATKPVPTFTGDRDLPVRGSVSVVNYREYDILPNGKEFVMVIPAAQAGASAAAPPRRISVVVNWFEELKARVPGR